MPQSEFPGSVFFNMTPEPPLAIGDPITLKAVLPEPAANYTLVWSITKPDANNVPQPAPGFVTANATTVTWNTNTAPPTTEGRYTIRLTATHISTGVIGVRGNATRVESYEIVVDLVPALIVTIDPTTVGAVQEGTVVALQARVNGAVQPASETLQFQWFAEPPSGAFGAATSASTEWNSEGARRGISQLRVTVTQFDSNGNVSAIGRAQSQATVTPRPLAKDDIVPITARRVATTPTPDLALWVVIRKSTEAVSFVNYSRFMDIVLCGAPLLESERGRSEELLRFGLDNNGSSKQFVDFKQNKFLPYNDVEAYRLLKIATEAFLMVNCGVALNGLDDANNWRARFNDLDATDIITRVGVNMSVPQLRGLWEDYLANINGIPDATLPYLALIREKLKDSQLKEVIFGGAAGLSLPRECFGIIRSKLTNPCLLELIWSYWHEEGMLVQALNAISLRFQNIRTPGAGRDPLSNLEIDPLRPLNNLMWGYIQDEQHRLSLMRRAYEYDHHYGMSLFGKALSNFRPADSRSKFIEAFHNLMHLANVFYKEDDDTTMVADGFPLLNALKEVHLVLSEGAHNQFGDLPSTARVEMLMQEWLLARPEFREFLPTRIMVAYPEAWMDRVDAMKKLQGWTDTSILHFRNLGVFGEQILLAVRFGSWSEVNNPVQASNWARFWRSEIQGYIHAYRAATGVDLMNEASDTRDTSQRYLPPSVHLRHRLAQQLQKV